MRAPSRAALSTSWRIMAIRPYSNTPSRIMSRRLTTTAVSTTVVPRRWRRTSNRDRVMADPRGLRRPSALRGLRRRGRVAHVDERDPRGLAGDEGRVVGHELQRGPAHVLE